MQILDPNLESLDNIVFLFARVFLLEMIGLKNETFTSPELCQDVFFCRLFRESLDLRCGRNILRMEAKNTTGSHNNSTLFFLDHAGSGGT